MFADAELAYYRSRQPAVGSVKWCMPFIHSMYHTTPIYHIINTSSQGHVAMSGTAAITPVKFCRIAIKVSQAV